MNDEFTTIGSMIGFFILTPLIFVGAYYASKFLGKRYSIQASSSGGMRVVDKLALGRDHDLLIIETGGKTLLIGVSPQHMETLAELDSEELAHLPAMEEGTDFFSVLKNRIGKKEKQG